MNLNISFQSNLLLSIHLLLSITIAKFFITKIAKLYKESGLTVKPFCPFLCVL